MLQLGHSSQLHAEGHRITASTIPWRSSRETLLPMHLLRVPVEVQLERVQAYAKDSQAHALLQARSITVERRRIFRDEKRFLF